MLFFKKKTNSVLLEMPIETKKSDIFGVEAYVKRLIIAINQGAKFIAIDGEYGTGKSSIVNLLQKQIKTRKKIFIKVNSLNISDEHEFNRYFINKIATQILKDPYEIERMFYKQSFSYSSVKPIRSKFFKIIIDKILLLSIGLLFCNTIFKFIFTDFFKKYEILDIVDSYVPFILLVAFTCVLLYGYGFSKPEEEQSSPILNVDKNRNNLLKILNNHVSPGSTIFFIIDDLDRLKGNLIQEKILTLLYNEYYPLDKSFRKIKFVFIFMINLNDLNFTKIPILKDSFESNVENNEEVEQRIKTSNSLNVNTTAETIIIDENKLFDFKLKVSNNQNEILYIYLQDSIKNHIHLNHIFSDIDSKSVYNLILKINDDIRKIKHFLNNVLNKYEYITTKKIDNFKINNQQLVLICLLESLTSDTAHTSSILSNCLYKINQTESDENITTIIKQLENCIDTNYLIYIFNFIDHRNLLNQSELEVIDLCEKYGITQNYQILFDVNNLFNSKLVRPEKIYEKIYNVFEEHITTLLYSSDFFVKYLKSQNLYNINDTKYDDLYKRRISYEFYKYNSEDIDLNIFLKSIYEIEPFINEDLNPKYPALLLTLIGNLKDNLLQIDNISEIFNFELTKGIFDLLYKIPISYTYTPNNNSKPIEEEKQINVKSNLLFELYRKEIIIFKNIKTYFSVEFIKNNNINLIEYDLYYMLLKEKENNNIFAYILTNTSDVKNFYDNFDSNWKQDLLSFKDIIKIIKTYGYNKVLDGLIIQKFDNKDKQQMLLDEINNNNFNLSTNLLNFIDSFTFLFKFNDNYINQFNDQKFVKTVIKSNALKNNNTIELNGSQYITKLYINAIYSIFIETSLSDIKKLKFNNKVIDIIYNGIIKKNINGIDLNKLYFLILQLNISKIKEILKLLNSNNINDISKLYLKETEHNKELLIALYPLTTHSPIKSNITKKLKVIK